MPIRFTAVTEGIPFFHTTITVVGASANTTKSKGSHYQDITSTLRQPISGMFKLASYHDTTEIKSFHVLILKYVGFDDDFSHFGIIHYNFHKKSNLMKVSKPKKFISLQKLSNSVQLMHISWTLLTSAKHTNHNTRSAFRKLNLMSIFLHQKARFKTIIN